MKKLIQESWADKEHLQVLQQIYRVPGYLIAKALEHTFVWPNLVTYSGVVFALIGGILMFYGYYGWGIVLANLSLLMDYSDGSLARLKQQFSHFGLWVESIFVDKVSDILVYAGYGIGLYVIYHEVNLLYLTLALIVFRVLISIANDSVNFWPEFNQIQSNSEIKFTFKPFRKKSPWVWLAKQAVWTRTNVYALLTLGILFHHRILALVFVGVYQVLFYLAYVAYFGRWLKNQEPKKQKTKKK